MAASHQWMKRPDDERYTSLTDMLAHFETMRANSQAIVVPSRRLQARPDGDRRGLTVLATDGKTYNPTNYAFAQLAARAEAPAGYLRTIPSDLAADCINFGLQFKRDIEDVGMLLYHNGDTQLRAVTGPNYGRIWNEEIVRHLVDRFGDGVTGQWRVPGEFRQAVPITKANTTLYAGDRDMFVFLCDETDRIELPNRRNGKPGSLARGFFVWNSEVGSTTYGMATFLYDEVCCNRIVWGASEYKEIRVRHTSSAPDKFLDETRPALEAYARGSASTIVSAIDAARKARLDGSDGELDKFLTNRFSKRLSAVLQETHKAEEGGRPIENLWDVATAVTAYARNVTWQDERVALERKAGEVLALAA